MNFPTHVKNTKLKTWVQDMVDLCQPDKVHWCDGSLEEYNQMCQTLVESGTFIKLNPEKRPNSFLARSDPSDVARVEDRTFICSVRYREAGPTNNWMAPKEMHATLNKLFDGCMRGRTVYHPFQHGTVGVAPLPHRGGSNRLSLCSGKYAHYDPYGPACPGNFG
jgi:phosphoenolpyruvate carboxykinase (GTP)